MDFNSYYYSLYYYFYSLYRSRSDDGETNPYWPTMAVCVLSVVYFMLLASVIPEQLRNDIKLDVWSEFVWIPIVLANGVIFHFKSRWLKIVRKFECHPKPIALKLKIFAIVVYFGAVFLLIVSFLTSNV